MKKLLAALLLLPSFALAQDVTHEQIEQNYAKCEALPHHAPNVRPLSAAVNAQPVWDDPTIAESCAKLWAKWKAHRDELNSQKTKDDIKAFVDKLK